MSRIESKPVIAYPPGPENLSALDGKTVAVIGFGNQGRAQALNLRDSGVHTVVGNRDDPYLGDAREHGFAPSSIRDASANAQIVVLLVPDDAQAAVFTEHLLPMRPGTTVVFASGYALYHQLVTNPARVNTVMVAPRMVGTHVRSRYLDGTGSPAFVSVETDATGDAERIAVAYAEAIGCTRGGCFPSSPREEVALDLFGEQALWPAVMALLEAAYGVLADAGFSDAAILHELYLSGEPAEIFHNAAEIGLLNQLRHHSPASQLGQLATQISDPAFTEIREQFTRILQHDILDGAFARQWADPDVIESSLNRLYTTARHRPLHKAEQRLRDQRPPTPKELLQ